MDELGQIGGLEAVAGVGDVGDVVIRDRRHLSEDGMVLAVMAIHQQSGELVAGPPAVVPDCQRATC